MARELCNMKISRVCINPFYQKSVYLNVTMFMAIKSKYQKFSLVDRMIDNTAVHKT